MQPSAPSSVREELAASSASDRLSRLDRASQLEHAMASIDVALSVRVPPVDPTPRVDFDMRKRTYRELAVVNMQCGPLSAARTSRQAAGFDDALVTALLVRSGTEMVGQNDSMTLLRPGDLMLWNCGRRARFVVGTFIEKRLMVVPAGILNTLSANRFSEPGLTVMRRSPATRLLNHFLESLLASDEDLGSTAAACVRNAALELLASSLHSSERTDIHAPSIALRPSIEDWIDNHLGNTVITPAVVAAEHSVSIRTVHRVFAETGDTLGSVIRLRKLMRARRELECTDHSIAAIASYWGFADSSHFTRTFKQQFGMSPSDFRGLYHDGDRAYGGGIGCDGTAVQLPGTGIHAAGVVKKNTHP